MAWCVNLTKTHTVPFYSGFVEEKMGAKYVENRQVEFAKSYEESGPGTPIFFILSPGVDPLKDVEALGKKLGFTFDNKNFHNVSLGQVSGKSLVMWSNGCLPCRQVYLR